MPTIQDAQPDIDTQWRHFSVHAQDGPARSGELRLPRGTVHTPAFMPVGTQAAVKALTPDDLRTIGAEIILGNTYHLMLRPGPDLIEELGGISRFMRWDGPILTDSGGYQVFSLAGRRELSDQGVTFQSHLDGSIHELTPERAIRLQRQFGSDISMTLDVCVGYDASPEEQLRATELTHTWLPRNLAAFGSEVDIRDGVRPLLFGISQGGFDADLRAESASIVGSFGFDGCAIGGLSVGEPKDVMAEMLAASLSGLPTERPRYLMGVGSPEDLWNAVAVGVDMFDCVLPTRVARHGGLYTPDGRINARAARYRAIDAPIDDQCDCYTCRNFSLAYLHHLYRAGELLVHRLATIHNLRFIIHQMQSMRAAIQNGHFDGTHRGFIARYQSADQSVADAQRRRFREQAASRR